MATRPTGYGLTADTKRKISSKYDHDCQVVAQKWLEGILGEKLTESSAEEAEALEFVRALKDGIYLCRVGMALDSQGMGKYSQTASNKPFKMMENIEIFLRFCSNYGMKKDDLFQVPDLYENQNIHQVICTIHALGRMAQKNGYQAPFILGPKESASNKREFSEEQLRQSNTIIGLQMGSNKGATQAGMIMGKNRQIID